ncbi:hypothetical protein BC828DRAFT_376558 [Blastocladiella britannica]|nr:hypothetical protein BC828DRAFT_376558 [Blastocladiella britannica]
MAKEAKHQEEEQTELDINDALRARAALEETVDVAQTLDPRIAVSRSEHEPVHQAPFGATAVPGPSIGAPALLGRSGGAHRNAVIAINDLGQIEEVNQGALSLFGIESSRELRGRNVNVIMPEPYRSFHDGWISSYRQAANKPTLGTPRIVFGHHSRGWSFPIQLRIMESFESPTSKHQFVGLITPLPVQSRTGAIIISTKGVIQLVERSICTMFNYKPNELVGHNISILMPRELAVQHDMILARYAGPAKSRVVGIPTGRFLMGQSKNGVLFPISVEVYEEYIGSVLFFRGAIRDLTLLVGEAFLDAAGTLVNCNDDLLGMFGYKRPAIIGQNVSASIPFFVCCRRIIDNNQYCFDLASGLVC